METKEVFDCFFKSKGDSIYHPSRFVRLSSPSSHLSVALAKSRLHSYLAAPSHSIGLWPEGIGFYFLTIPGSFPHTSPPKNTRSFSPVYPSMLTFSLPNMHFHLLGRFRILPSLLLISDPHSFPFFLSLHFFSG